MKDLVLYPWHITVIELYWKSLSIGASITTLKLALMLQHDFYPCGNSCLLSFWAVPKKTLQNDCFHTNGCGPLTLTKQTWWSLERARLEIKPITLVIGGGQVSAMYSGFVSFCPGPSELLGFWGTFCEPA